MKGLRLIGDVCHASSILLFLWIVRWKGNAAGVSLKSHCLYLLTFLLRYSFDLFTAAAATAAAAESYSSSWYNTGMKIYFIIMTAWIIYSIQYYIPAKETYYSSNLDNYHFTTTSTWALAFGSGIFAMMIHLLGSGTIDINGESGQEFQVHLEQYQWESFLWTWSICLEPLAMIPQLYMFRNDRLAINKHIRMAIFLKGIYRIFYIMNWIQQVHEMPGRKRHVLVSITSCLQVFFYLDFFLYHTSVCLLLCIRKCATLQGDDDAIITESGIDMVGLDSEETETLLLLEQPPDEQSLSQTPSRPPPTKEEIEEIIGMPYV